MRPHSLINKLMESQMKIRLIVLVIVSAGATSLFSAPPTDPWSADQKNKTDVVWCTFVPKKDPKNISGAHAISFLALENLRRQREPDRANFSASYYDILANIASHKMEKTFYKCMSNLERPDVAVRDGEYKKCIKEAWDSRPWGAIDIQVNEKTKSKKRGSGEKWVMEGRNFSWYDPIKSLSFLD